MKVLAWLVAWVFLLIVAAGARAGTDDRELLVSAFCDDLRDAMTLASLEDDALYDAVMATMIIEKRCVDVEFFDEPPLRLRVIAVAGMVQVSGQEPMAIMLVEDDQKRRSHTWGPLDLVPPSLLTEA